MTFPAQIVSEQRSDPGRHKQHPRNIEASTLLVKLVPEKVLSIRLVVTQSYSMHQSTVSLGVASALAAGLL